MRHLLVGNLTLLMILLSTLLWGEAQAATYANCGTTEPTWNAHVSLLWCDDFEDGDKLHDTTGTANAANDGWWQVPFYVRTETVVGFGRCGTATGTATVVGGAPGYRGTNCAATSGNHPATDGEGQIDSMAAHSLSATNVNELHYRWFFRCIKTTASTTTYSPAISGCSWSTNTKYSGSMLSSRDTTNFLDIGTLFWNPENEQVGTGRCNQAAGKPSGCQFGSMSFNNRHLGTFMDQTMTDTLSAGVLSANNCTVGYACYIEGSYSGWYYVEIYMLFGSNNTANATYKLWIAKCGTDGTSCNSSTPETDYLRASYTGTTLCPGDQAAAVCGINSIENELYSSGDGTNFVLDGEWYEDQHVAIAGNTFIGPSIESINGSSGGGGSTPPAGDSPYIFFQSYGANR